MRKYDWGTEQQILDKALAWKKTAEDLDPVEAYIAGYHQSCAEIEEGHHHGEDRHNGRCFTNKNVPRQMGRKKAVEILKMVHPVVHLNSSQEVADAIEEAITWMEGFADREDEVMHEVVDAMDMWPEIQDKVCFPKRDAVMVIQPAKFYPGDAVHVIIRKSEM